MNTELYSHSIYRDYHLFVECISLDGGVNLYEGVARYNSTTIFTSQSLVSGDSADCILKDKINEYEDSSNGY